MTSPSHASNIIQSEFLIYKQRHGCYSTRTFLKGQLTDKFQLKPLTWWRHKTASPWNILHPIFFHRFKRFTKMSFWRGQPFFAQPLSTKKRTKFAERNKKCWKLSFSKQRFARLGSRIQSSSHFINSIYFNI